MAEACGQISYLTTGLFKSLLSGALLNSWSVIFALKETCTGAAADTPLTLDSSEAIHGRRRGWVATECFRCRRRERNACLREIGNDKQ